MNGKNVVTLGDPSGATDASNKKECLYIGIWISFASASIAHSSVEKSATSSIETISRVSTHKSPDCTRSLVYLHKYNSVTP